MNRTGRQLAVCTILGVATTYAVAWTITAKTWMSVSVHWTSLVQPGTLQSMVRSVAPAPPGEVWHFGVASQPGASACISWSERTERKADPIGSVILESTMVGVTQEWNSVRRTTPAPPRWSIGWRDPEKTEFEGEVAYYHEFAAGWPLLAVRCMRTINSTLAGTRVELHGGFKRPAWLNKSSEGATYPAWPIWLNFAGNTTIYGSAWFVLLFGYGFARRRLRKQAGSCAECGYDMRGSPGKICPECGKPGRGLNA